MQPVCAIEGIEAQHIVKIKIKNLYFIIINRIDAMLNILKII